MKTAWLLLALAVLVGANLALASPSQPSPRIVLSSDSPALVVKDAWVDMPEGKVRGAVSLRFGYGVPLLPHVHIYGLDGAGRVIAEGCDKLGGQLLSGSRPSGNGSSTFSVSLGMAGVTTVRVVASAGHNDDCRPKDNRIFKLF